MEMSRPFYTSTDLTAYPDFKEHAPEAFEAYNAWPTPYRPRRLSRRTGEGTMGFPLTPGDR